MQTQRAQRKRRVKAFWNSQKKRGKFRLSLAVLDCFFRHNFGYTETAEMLDVDEKRVRNHVAILRQDAR